MTISGIFFTRYRLSITRTRTSQACLSVCIRVCMPSSRKRSRLEGKLRARAVYRCPWRLRALATPNPPALPHAAASIVTSTLTPFSTGIGAHFITRSHPPRRFDWNFRPRERNNIEARTIYSRAREFVKKISPDT